MTLDFTLKKYQQIIESIADSKYKVVTVKDYIESDIKPSNAIIIRHDVDLDADYQLQFARLESDLGIHTSYYFRHIEKIYKQPIINQIYELGHEVGYHYEVITKAKGDKNKAIDLFKKELSDFQRNWHTKTVCPHGGSFVENVDGYALKDIVKLIPKLLSKTSVFSNWTNFNIWKENKFSDFKLTGDAYDSIDFSGILYLSDTGRSWDKKYKRLDKVESLINPQYHISSSNDIIKLIGKGEVDKIYLLVHFEQWKNTFLDWLSWYIAQLIRRNGKKIIFKLKMKK
ncbi:MAG: hypothetical protein K9G76_00325 [Bacteroidales bacterium]|nr:hypothetical protein [Bacteroidales bacterium]MCF8402557.1 hypothetical protein [Bacteroidales bacterium]